jgi:hypothetical protein
MASSNRRARLRNFRPRLVALVFAPYYPGRSGRSRAKIRTKSRLWPVKKGEISYAEKAYGVTKAELKRRDSQYQRDLKAGRVREYHGDIETMLRDWTGRRS